MLRPRVRLVISRTRSFIRTRALRATIRLSSPVLDTQKVYPKKLRSHGRATALLRFVDSEMELREEPPERLHHVLAGTLRPHVHIAVVGVSTKGVTAFL